MKIAFCHYNTPQSVIDVFQKKWPMYESIPISNHIDESDVKLEDITDYSTHLMDSQRILTGKLCDDMMKGFEKAHVVYNNTMLNILADSLLSVESGVIKNTDFLTTQFHITQNMFKFLDIIFYLVDESPTEDSWELATRQIFEQYNKDSWDQTGLIFPLTDRPAFIEVPFDPKHPEKVVNTISEFIDRNGKLFEPEGLDLSSELKALKNGISEEDIKKFFT
jgi:hypothetical protein